MPDTRLNTIEHLDRLIAFDTTSSKSNLALIDHIEALLDDQGIACRRTANEAGTKANLFATIGPMVAGGAVLSGHTDVVPVEGQAWDSDPFTMRRDAGRLYGRGTSDMKGFIAAALAMIPAAQAAPLKKPLHLAFTYDEEIGCFGVGPLIEDLKAAVPMPRVAIVGEPTGMRPISAHKGVTVYRTTVIGRDAHSSLTHLAASAIEAAAKLVVFLSDLGEANQRESASGSRFVPPYSSLNVGTIQGGTAQNIVPKTCSFTWEFRVLPGDQAERYRQAFETYASETVLPALRRTAPEAEIRTEVLADVPPLAPEDNPEAENLVRALTGANEAGAMSFGSEAGIFQRAGFSTVLCGPGFIEQAHQPNEFIEIDQLDACDAFLARLIDWAC